MARRALAAAAALLCMCAAVGARSLKQVGGGGQGPRRLGFVRAPRPPAARLATMPTHLKPRSCCLLRIHLTAEVLSIAIFNTDLTENC